MVIQEARTELGFSSNANILRFCSGHEAGRFGMEFWIDLTIPFAAANDKQPRFFEPKHFQVTHTDPRRLLLRSDAGDFSCWLYALHAPHSGHPEQERITWWEHAKQILAEAHDGDTILLC